MKKIVALVLALALALSLCTVAMADTYASVTSYGEDNVASASDWNKTANATVTIKKVADAVTNTYFNEKFDKPAEYVLEAKDKDTGNVQSGNKHYWLTDSTCADIVVVNGKTVTYLMEVPEDFVGFPQDMDITVVKSEKASKAKDAVCGKYYYGKAATTLYVLDYETDLFEGVVLDGFVYVENAASNIRVLVDGKVIKLTRLTKGTKAADAINDTDRIFFYKDHDYDWDTKAVNGDQVVTKVYCADCDKTFTFLQTDDEAKAVEKFGEGNYDQVLAFHPVDVDDNLLYVLTESAKDAGTTSTTVDSSKTFDAGVAMYVGLSLMSVAGSAVVIGKKKEF